MTDAQGRVPAPGTNPLDVSTGEMPQVDPIDVPTGEVSPVDPYETGEMPAADEPPETPPSALGDGQLIVLSDGPLPVGLPPEARLRRPYDGPPPRRSRRDWVDLVDRWFPERYRVPTVVTTAVALVLTAGFLYLPLVGTALSAQMARRDFFEQYGWLTVDFRWFGGTYAFGDSLLGPPLATLLGIRGLGAVSCVVSAAGFAWLLARFGVRRPTVGGILAAGTAVCNLVVGRTMFGLGMAIGTLALVAICLPRGPRWLRYGAGGVLAVAATLGSSLAGLFLGLAGGAALLAGVRLRPAPATDQPATHSRGRLHAAIRTFRRRVGPYLGPGAREGAVLCAGSVLGLIPTLLFQDGGTQPFTSDSMKVFIAVGVATFFLLPKRYRAMRVGAVLMIALTIAMYLVPSPIGSNVTRLPMLYAVPVIAAMSTVDVRFLAGALVVLTWWQPPLTSQSVGNSGEQTAQSAFYSPLIDKVHTLGPVGRIEVVPLADHWDAAYIANAVPLARGAERQVDVARNPIFYGSSLAPDTYLTWLYRNAVGYVALPTSAKLDSSGREESHLIAAHPQYLKKIWANADWTLYRVVGAQQLVSGAGVLVSSGPTGVTFDTTSSGRLTVRVRWSRWLTLSGPDACFARGPGDWVTVRVGEPGRYRISSGWHLVQSHHC
jgi:hypothetical protein